MSNPNPSPSTRFKKGQSGNPAGMPKGRSVTAVLRRMAAEPAFEGHPLNKGEMVASMLLSLAMKGDLGAIREFLDRTEGKSIARTEQGEPGDFGLDLVAARKVLTIVPRTGS